MQNSMLDFFQELGRKRKHTWLIISLLVAVFLGIADYLTGYELSFSIFYLIPVSAATLISGRNVGIITSIVSAVIWIIADIMSGANYANMMIPFWNTFVRLGYFMINTLLLSYLLKLINEHKQKSLIDPLTGAANWRYFEEYAQKKIARERRSKKPMTLAYFDLDNFKQVNDSLGHDVGDDLLKTVAEIIQSQLRQ